jgi:hypothetical protein
MSPCDSQTAALVTFVAVVTPGVLATLVTLVPKWPRTSVFVHNVINLVDLKIWNPLASFPKHPQY